MLDIGDYWSFGIPSVSITLELKIVTPVLHEIAVFLAPFEGASSYHVLWAWLVIWPNKALQRMAARSARPPLSFGVIFLIDKHLIMR